MDGKSQYDHHLLIDPLILQAGNKSRLYSRANQSQ